VVEFIEDSEGERKEGGRRGKRKQKMLKRGWGRGKTKRKRSKTAYYEKRS
jgi:hypothetical protein